ANEALGLTPELRVVEVAAELPHFAIEFHDHRFDVTGLRDGIVSNPEDVLLVQPPARLVVGHEVDGLVGAAPLAGNEGSEIPPDRRCRIAVPGGNGMRELACIMPGKTKHRRQQVDMTRNAMDRLALRQARTGYDQRHA